jgi:hypothetical protein
MLERSTHTEVVRPGTPVARGTVILLPIERVVLHTVRGNTRVWFSAVKEPYALVVRDAGGIWAINTDAVAVSLERLCQRVPGLDTVLEDM